MSAEVKHVSVSDALPNSPARPCRCAGLGGQLGTTLAATRRNDGTAGTGTHPGTEAVHLRAAAIVWLERTLAHDETLRD